MRQILCFEDSNTYGLIPGTEGHGFFFDNFGEPSAAGYCDFNAWDQ